jgi:hypothetical protein
MSLVVVVFAATRFAPLVSNADSLPMASLDALTNGWSAVVTSPIPAVAEARMLVPVAVLSWAAVVGGLACQRRGALSLAPGVVAYVAASLAAGAHQFAASFVAVALMVLAAAVLHEAGRLHLARRRGSRRRAAPVGALGVVCAAALVAVGAGPRLSAERANDPFDPRNQLHAPTVPDDAVNPLDQVALRRRAGDAPMFTIEASEPVFTRLVALNVFDGARWSTAAPYERAGAVITPVRRAVASRDVTVTVSMAGLDGPWLPSVGDPNRVLGAQVLVDPGSGSLIAAGGDALGARYTLRATLPEPDVRDLQSLAVGASDSGVEDDLPEGLPAPLATMADVSTTDGTTPFVKALLLQNYLRESFERDDSKVAGFSYGHLTQALTQRGTATEEQFAAAFAVLGRAIGLPTRLVVGFEPGVVGADGRYIVRAVDVRVWPEVLFDRVGWIAFDPAPSSETESDAAMGPGGGVELQQAPPAEAEPLPAPADVTAHGDAPVGGRSWRRVAQWSGVVAGSCVLVAAVGAATVAAIKRRRTARRRATNDPRQAVIGAWHDVLDRLHERGIPSTRHMTVEEIVQYSEPVSTSLAGMFRPVSKALYGDGVISDDEAAQAWKSRDRFVHSLQRNESRRCRVRRAIDPRPLLTQSSTLAQPSKVTP